MSNKLRIFYAMVIVAIASGTIVFLGYPEVAVLAGLAGVAFIGYRYANHCKACGSWRTTKVEEFFPDSFNEEFGTVVAHRHCLSCNARQYLGSYPLETWEWETRDL